MRRISMLAAAASLALGSLGNDLIRVSPTARGPGRRRSAIGPGRTVAPYLNDAYAQRAKRRWERAERAFIEKGKPIAGHIGTNAMLANRFLGGAV